MLAFIWWEMLADSCHSVLEFNNWPVVYRHWVCESVLLCHQGFYSISNIWFEIRSIRPGISCDLIAKVYLELFPMLLRFACTSWICEVKSFQPVIAWRGFSHSIGILILSVLFREVFFYYKPVIHWFLCWLLSTDFHCWVFVQIRIRERCMMFVIGATLLKLYY